MLKYTGGGFKGWLPGIPARDLTDEEVEQYGGKEFLLRTGLYEEPEPENEDVEEVDDGGK